MGTIGVLPNTAIYRHIVPATAECALWLIQLALNEIAVFDFESYYNAIFAGHLQVRPTLKQKQETKTEKERRRRNELF